MRENSTRDLNKIFVKKINRGYNIHPTLRCNNNFSISLPHNFVINKQPTVNIVHSFINYLQGWFHCIVRI